jgi:hypothetical protein
MFRKIAAWMREFIDRAHDDSDPPIDQPRDERDMLADEADRQGRIW